MLLFCSFICAISAAVDTGYLPYSFFAIWTNMLCCAYSVYGTIILRNLDKRTPIALGFLLGFGVALVNLLLTLAVTSGGGINGFKPASVRAPPPAPPFFPPFFHAPPF